MSSREERTEGPEGQIHAPDVYLGLNKDFRLNIIPFSS